MLLKLSWTWSVSRLKLQPAFIKTSDVLEIPLREVLQNHKCIKFSISVWQWRGNIWLKICMDIPVTVDFTVVRWMHHSDPMYLLKATNVNTKVMPLPISTQKAILYTHKVSILYYNRLCKFKIFGNLKLWKKKYVSDYNCRCLNQSEVDTDHAR